MPEAEEAGLIDYIRAFTPRWFTAMSGPLSVPAALAAAWVENTTLRIVLVFTAIASFIFASHSVWAVERVKRLTAEKKLVRNARLAIKSVQFDPNCLTDFYINLEISNASYPTTFRNWRLAVRRDGHEMMSLPPHAIYGGKLLANVLDPRAVQIDDLSSNPLESGAYRDARFTFTADEGNRKELEKSGTVFSLTTNDVTGAMLMAEHVLP